MPPRTMLAERQQPPRTAACPTADGGKPRPGAERNARTRRLVEAGGLIQKTGLFAREPNALYGGLLSLSERAADQHQVAKWEAERGRAFAREA